MCLFFAILFVGPRFGIFVYWLAWPARWDAAFDTWIVPLLGIVLFPWTVLMWVLVAPGGVNGFDLVIVGLGFVLDVASTGMSGRGYSQQRVA